MAGTPDSLFLGIERSVGGRRWRTRLADDRLSLALTQRLALPELVGRILAARGVGLAEAEDFLNPTLRTALPNPSRLADMDRAAERLADAVAARQRIALLGDYDVDGATASALLHRVLARLGAAPRLYIPDRLREGYGPNSAALRRLKEEGAELVLTLDCGTTAFTALEQAAEDGLEVIVVDHHICEPRLPRAFAVVNPNRLDDESDCGTLAAVGVAFLLAIALNRALRARGFFRLRAEPDLRAELDLVALGTVCDQVALTGINRALVTQGLKIMAERGNTGLKALADAAGLKARPGAYHAGFVLGPRVNAGGRVGESDLGVRLLTSEDADEALTLAHRLNALNAERQAIEATVLDEANAEIEARPELREAPVIVTAGAGWHPGVIGIVASRLVERWRRPVALVALKDGVGRGSARSIAGADLGAAITAARQAGLLVNGGGHPMAAGFTVTEERLGALAAFLCDRLASAVAAAQSETALGFDGAIQVSAATAELARCLERLGPFGVGNSEPRFAVIGARLQYADVVGGSHVRCTLAGPDGARLKAIAFRSVGTPLGLALLQGTGGTFHVAGHLRCNDFRGASRAQLFIDDLARP